MLRRLGTSMTDTVRRGHLVVVYVVMTLIAALFVAYILSGRAARTHAERTLQTEIMQVRAEAAQLKSALAQDDATIARLHREFQVIAKHGGRVSAAELRRLSRQSQPRTAVMVTQPEPAPTVTVTRTERPEPRPTRTVTRQPKPCPGVQYRGRCVPVTPRPIPTPSLRLR